LFTHSSKVNTIVSALRGDVVPLIQDLNGNHVIQKCLTQLRPEDAQFVYDAAGKHALIVGTHRHGCCVLQRCIDHATGIQKNKLIHDITVNSFTLVQDPFGNYVIQYILDLNYVEYTKPLCYCFQGSIVQLSKQKFSSNVIEKCIRVADPLSQTMMVEELVVDGAEMERMLRDPYANYVMQTAVRCPISHGQDMNLHCID
jgi:Pumilio-family RNA binding repeat